MKTILKKVGDDLVIILPKNKAKKYCEGDVVEFELKRPKQEDDDIFDFCVPPFESIGSNFEVVK